MVQDYKYNFDLIDFSLFSTDTAGFHRYSKLTSRWFQCVWEWTQWRIYDFPEEGANPIVRGANLLFGKISAKNCMKIKEILKKLDWERWSSPIKTPPPPALHMQLGLDYFAITHVSWNWYWVEELFPWSLIRNRTLTSFDLFTRDRFVRNCTKKISCCNLWSVVVAVYVDLCRISEVLYKTGGAAWLLSQTQVLVSKVLNKNAFQ